MGFLRRPTTKSRSPEDDFAALSEQLRKAGADPTVPHVTRHFMYVPGVKAAQQVARKVKAHGREIDVETSARTGFWLVVVSQSMLVTQENLETIKGEFEAVAKQSGGEYDRWQVELAGG